MLYLMNCSAYVNAITAYGCKLCSQPPLDRAVHIYNSTWLYVMENQFRFVFILHINLATQKRDTAIKIPTVNIIVHQFCSNVKSIKHIRWKQNTNTKTHNFLPFSKTCTTEKVKNDNVALVSFSQSLFLVYQHGEIINWKRPPGGISLYVLVCAVLAIFQAIIHSIHLATYCS